MPSHKCLRLNEIWCSRRPYVFLTYTAVGVSLLVPAKECCSQPATAFFGEVYLILNDRL